MVFMFPEGPPLGNFDLLDIAPGGTILHLAHADDVPALVSAIQPDAEEVTFAERTYIRGKAAGGRGACVFVDGRIVVVADEEHLRRLIVAGRDGSSQAKWTQSWQAAAPADAMALANVRAIRNLLALSGQEALTMAPPSASPLSETATALLSVDMREQINFRLNLFATKPSDTERLAVALRSLVTLNQAGLSLFRKSASGDAGTTGAALLGILEVLDAVLDSVEIHYHERNVNATATISNDDAAKIFVPQLLAESARWWRSLNAFWSGKSRSVGEGL